MWRNICLVMKKNFSARSDVIWPFKKIICQNRINKISQNVAKMLKKICLNLPNSAKMLKKICLKNKIIRNKIWSIKVVKKYLFSNEKKISARSDVVWPFKKIICQNRINKIGQIQPKCLRNYAWLMMMWHIVWSKKNW